MSRTLIDITDDLHAIDDLLAEAGGDVSDPAVCEAIESWMTELDTDLKKKVDGYAGYLTELAHRVEVRKAESKRLYNLAATDMNTIRSMKDRLMFALKELGIKKVETMRYVVSVQKNGGVAPLDIQVPAEELPPRFQTVKTTVSSNGEAIRQAIAAGEEVEGCTLMERGESLRVR